MYCLKALLAPTFVLQMLVLPCLVPVAGVAGTVAITTSLEQHRVSVVPETSVSTVFASPSSTELVYFEPSSIVDSLLAPSETQVNIFRVPSETQVADIDYDDRYNNSIRFAYTISSPYYTIDSTRLHTFCWYPISGGYGRLPRILLYTTLVFALVPRIQLWLIGGALAAGMVYSGVAAIHACLISWVGPIDGELDQQALLAILGTSCIITVPLLNWSSRIRDMGKQKRLPEGGVTKGDSTRTVIVYWGFLVLVGFICVFYNILYNDPAWPVDGLITDNITCSPKGKFDLLAGQKSSWTRLILTEEFIDANNCFDPCQKAASSFKNTVFRSSDDLRLLNISQINFFRGEDLSDRQQRKSDAFDDFMAITYFVIPYVLLQGLWAVLFGRRSPSQIRDSVYLKICEVGVSKNAKAPRWRKWIAKWAGLVTYFWAVFIGIIVCPPLFVTNIVMNEINLSNFPQSESSSHIGQWGPWAATALVLIGALISEFHSKFDAQVVKFVKWLARCGRETTTNSHEYVDDAAESHFTWARVEKEYQDTITFWKDPLSPELDGQRSHSGQCYGGPWHTDRHGRKRKWDNIINNHSHECIVKDRYGQESLCLSENAEGLTPMSVTVSP